jgi:SAM-dependent methyltransferase
MGKDYLHNRKVYDSCWSPRWRRAHNYASQSKVKRFRALMRMHGLMDREGLRVFDQGFGLGLMLFCFRPSCALAGLELSPITVAGVEIEAERRGYCKTDFRVFEPGVICPVEWRQQFDVVISSHVLEHIEDPRPSLIELVNMIKPGGHACIAVPINESPGEDPNHFHLFSRDSFKALLEETGLTLIDLREEDRLWHAMAPISYGLARRPTALLRAAALVANCFGFAPHFLLKGMDSILKGFGFSNRQCFALCCKKGNALNE